MNSLERGEKNLQLVIKASHEDTLLAGITQAFKELKYKFFLNNEYFSIKI